MTAFGNFYVPAATSGTTSDISHLDPLGALSPPLGESLISTKTRCKVPINMPRFQKFCGLKKLTTSNVKLPSSREV